MSAQLSAHGRTGSIHKPVLAGRLMPVGQKPVATLSVLIGRGDALSDGDFGRSGFCADRTDEYLELRIGEELLEMLHGFPLIDDHHERSPGHRRQW